MSVLIKLYILILLIHLNQSAYVVPSSVLTYLGGSYTVILKDDTIIPQECYVTDGKVKYTIDLKTPQMPLVPDEFYNRNTANVNSKTDETILMTSLGYGLCGFKVENIGLQYVPEWNISFIDDTGETYTNSVKVVRQIRKPIGETTIYITVGDDIFISCGPEQNAISASVYAEFCELYNPQNVLVRKGSRSCEYSLSDRNSNLEVLGTWKCFYGYKFNMMRVLVNYKVIEKEVDIVSVWQNETSSHVNAGCQVTNDSHPLNPNRPNDIPVNLCVMVRPDGEKIILVPGLASKRYTAINTNLSQSICGMEILKPLEENEKGIWRCEIHYGSYKPGESNVPIGAFLNINGKSDDTKPPIEITKIIVAKENDSFTAFCKVPYSSSYCYMRGPDGTIYPVEDYRGVTLGSCEFTKESVALTDNGTWICGFARETGKPDDIYKFDVFVFGSQIIRADNDIVEARTSGSARLKCTTNKLGDYPIQYCRFFSPSGKVYTINEKQKSTSISYYGRGFNYGDCGIIIHEVSEVDEGTWSCVTRIRGKLKQNNEVYTNIHLVINDNLSMASALGIAAGVVVVAFGGIGLIVYRTKKNRRRRRRRNSNTFNRNDTNRSSNSSAESAEIFDLSNPNNNNNDNGNNNNTRRRHAATDTVTNNESTIVDVDIHQEHNENSIVDTTL